MNSLPLLSYQKRLLNEAAKKLDTYMSLIEVLPPGTSADKILDQRRLDYVEALTNLIKHAHELTTGCNVIATYPVNTNEKLLQ